MWDHLDADYLARLSARKYVSIYLERQLHLPTHKITNVNDLGLDKASLQLFQDYQRENTPDDTDGLNAFAAGMPGLIPLDDVDDEIDLGGWSLKFGNMFVHLEVGQQRKMTVHYGC